MLSTTDILGNKITLSYDKGDLIRIDYPDPDEGGPLVALHVSFAVRNRSIFSEPAGPVRERLIAILAG